MFRTPLTSTPTFKLVFGLSLCTVSMAMLYYYFKVHDDEEEAVSQAQTKATGKSIQRMHHKGKDVAIKLVIDNKDIPLLVGRGGKNINLIEERTNTRIRFSDKDNTHKYCELSGQPDNVKEANALIMKEIERCPIVKEVIYLPQSVCGKIMGRCGEAMQEICRLSLAKVSVDSGGTHSGGGEMSSSDKRCITITGNQQQVNIARKLIEDKIKEDEDLRRAVEEVEQTREPRRSPTNSITSSMYSSQTSLSSHLTPRDKLMSANVNNKAMEVYVSAVASPSKFWVQIVGPQSKKLDDLVKEMTSYYECRENRKMHEIQEPYLGQIVAAIFRYDGKWYRAEIVGILPNHCNPSEVVLDLYFVDYGDSEYVSPNEVFELRTDFLTLRFQAVECFLANVKSTEHDPPDTWHPQSIQKFEEMTEVASWKKLIARVVTYKERSKEIDGSAQYAAAREGAQIPGIELYDPTEGVEVNLGHILISHGYALPLDSNSASSKSNQTTHLQSPILTPPSTPLTSPSAPSNNNAYPAQHTADSAEDAFIQQQLQHLAKKNNNLYLNGHNTAETRSKLTAEFLNGNHYSKTALASEPDGTTTNINASF